MGKIQQRFVKLQKLLQVEPFKIVGLWSNGETRLHDFTSKIETWQNSSNRELKKLANPRIFKTAFVSDGTLAFSGSTVRVPGIPESQPVAFDRRVLYNEGQLIGNVVSYKDAIQHQKTRLNRRKRSVPLPEGFNDKSEPNIFIVDLEPINRISQKIGTPVTPLIVIGDELVELETTWTFSAL